MSEELSALEEYGKEVLIDIRTEKVMPEKRMFAGVQASSTEGVQACPSISHGAGSSRTTPEARTKHRDNILNAKLISRILIVYLPPLSGSIN
jgi:hypothetical protein